MEPVNRVKKFFPADEPPRADGPEVRVESSGPPGAVLPNPAIGMAAEWLLRQDPVELTDVLHRLQKLARTDGNRAAHLWSQSLERFLNALPISAEELLCLCWALRFEVPEA